MRAGTGIRIGTVVGLGVGVGLGLLYAQLYDFWRSEFSRPDVDSSMLALSICAVVTGLGGVAGWMAAWLSRRLGSLAAGAAVVPAVIGPFVVFTAVNDVHFDHATPTVLELLLANVAAVSVAFLVGAVLGSLVTLGYRQARRSPIRRTQ